MTQHLHRTFQDWCFRCHLSRDEAYEFQEELLARRAAYDFDGLVALLAATGGDLESETDRPFIADELLDSDWFRARLSPVGVVEGDPQQ